MIDDKLLPLQKRIKELERDLQESQSNREVEIDLRNIFERSLNEIYIFDAATLKFLKVNKGALKNIGYTMPELETMTAFDIKPEISKKQFNKMVSPLVNNTEDILKFETLHQRKDGSLYNVEVHLQLSTFQSKKAYVAIILDITDRKKAVKRQEELAHILEGSLNEIYIFDAVTLKFLKVNKGVLKNIGYTMSELETMTAFDIKPEVSEKEFNKMIKPLIDQTKDILQFETLHQRKDGSLYNVEVHLQLSTFQSKQAFVAIILDITDRKQTEEKIDSYLNDLEIAKEEAELANKAKSEFLANMSHEIRTPMGGIIGMSELLIDTKLTEKQQKYTKNIENCGKSLLVLINDILDLTKVSANELQLEEIDFSLCDTLQEVIDIFSIQALKNNIKLQCDTKSSNNINILGDPYRIRQVISNLVGNALKFTRNGSVTVSSSIEKEDEKKISFLIKVQDTGIGIEKDKLDTIFDKFIQEDSSTTREYGGSGLGLSICKALIDKMGGVINVESIKGKGSTFSIRLTLPKSSDIDLIKVSKASQKNRTKCWKMLVAEDNPINQMIIEEMLKKLGHKSTIVENGVEAIREAEKNDYDFILMDCQMPVMDGYSATQEIKSKMNKGLLKEIPIIAITAHALKGDRKKCLDSGMDDYISKPIKEEILEEALQKWSK